jgi:hypothetical protein
MVVQGTLDEIMDTWPPQLRVHTAEGYWQALMSEGTAITASGSPVAISALRPGVRIRITGEQTAPRGLAATSIEVGAGTTEG